MNRKLNILLFLFGIVFISQFGFAQIDFNKTPNDDLGNVEDRFQELFFEALKQKGIENYDRAVEALLKCIEINDSNTVLYYELGKNYKALKNFGAAEEALKKATNKEPDNEWYLDELYDVYAQQNDFDKAIKTVKQLVKYHPDYKEDLAALYFRTKKFNEALKILDELDEEFGLSNNRDILRNQIYAATGKKKAQIKNLVERVNDSPDKESNYLELIFRYSENNDKEKAYETAQKLLEIKPNSQIVHLALYKFYLDDNKTEKALESMKIVLQSTIIKPEAKLKVLSDFVKFVDTHPEYEDDLLEITTLVSDDGSGKTYLELAQYYLKKGEKAKALQYFESALIQDSDNYGIIRNVLLLYIDLNQYDLAAQKSNDALKKFPSQPLLYLINGVSLNNLKQPSNAIEILEIGLDYIIDDNKMESDYYKQISIAHSQLNNTSKAKTFNDKAKQLEETN